MTIKIAKKLSKAVYVFFHLLLLFSSTGQIFAGDSLSIKIPQEEVRKNNHGVYIFTSAEFEASSKAMGDMLVHNGAEKNEVHVYVESATFGFEEFRREVIAQSKDLHSVMIIFHFHGADAGGCGAEDHSCKCLQGNLCAIDRNVVSTNPDTKSISYISAENIVEGFIVPLIGKEITLFFRSCFSGHFAKKVRKIAASKSLGHATPIAIISTDNNTVTKTMLFPEPTYSRKDTLLRHWTDLKCADQYEAMRSFSDYVQFVNGCNSGFTFTFSALNGGESIEFEKFGFKDLTLYPAQELRQKNTLYEGIADKLQKVDVSELTVLVVETDREYENLAYGDMWIKSFITNGVEEKSIHWIKPTKSVADQKNPQVHSLEENFDFIPAHNKVLLFIRGDDESSKKPLTSETEPGQWDMVFGQNHLLRAEEISERLLPKVGMAHQILILLCSVYADVGFDQLIPLVDKGDFRTVTIVSFYATDRTYSRSPLGGWSMGFIAPLYFTDFLFYPSGKFQELRPHDEKLRKQVLEGLELFKNMISFEDYLLFLQKAEHSSMPQSVKVKVFNGKPNDLADFGFLPSKALPPLWKEW